MVKMEYIKLSVNRLEFSLFIVISTNYILSFRATFYFSNLHKIPQISMGLLHNKYLMGMLIYNDVYLGFRYDGLVE
jgi:hypothetical protein